ALEHVMGPQKQIEAVTIGAEDDADLCRSDIIEAVNRVDSGDGVAILTDMFGGTPSNLAISCMSRPKVEVLAGINLPMLVKLAKVREERSLPDAIAMAQAAGRNYAAMLALVMRAAGPGTPLVAAAIGPEAQAAIDAITDLGANKFNAESP